MYDAGIVQLDLGHEPSKLEIGVRIPIPVPQISQTKGVHMRNTHTKFLTSKQKEYIRTLEAEGYKENINFRIVYYGTRAEIKLIG